MGKLVGLNLGKGDLNRGFPSVTVQLSEDENSVPLQLTGSLPAAPELIALYRRWQLLYKLIYESLYCSIFWRKNESDEEIEIEEEDITNVSIVEFDNLCNDLQNTINSWLKSDSFRNIDQKLRTKLATTDEIKVILQTEDDRTRRLPWHLWNFFEDYPHAVACLSAPEYEPIQSLKKPSSKVIRILAILGNSQGIDVQKDRIMLEKLPGAETIFLVEPQRRELDRWLWDKKGWDILFFAGHSLTQADGETGNFYINQNDSLTITQLKNSLKAAIKQGLRLAIFNSCEGLGLASQLSSLHIPQMIVMREPVPDLVAQEFLKHFLEAFSHGESFYIAVREAGERLQGLENDYPCASWLPVICQNPAESPLVWPEKTQKTRKISHNILPSRQIIGAIFTMAIAVSAGMMVMRSQGILQFWELQFFDILMRSRLQEKPDPRILIVTVTEADVRSQPPLERGGASLSDRSLARLIAKLEKFKPRVIGLDIYREAAVKANYPNLANWMKKSDRFIAICKVSEDEKNSGVASPPEVPTQRLGFSDVVLDPDGILRRHLLAMAPASPCHTDKSLSFQLATRYLASYGIKTKLTPEKNWQFGNVLLKNLESNSGGYHGIDNLGHQVLLNWRSAAFVAPEVTLKDVLNNKLTSDLVKDRIVLIGTTAESFHDYWDTPYSASQWPHKPMPGVVVQAQMVSQIISAVLDRRPLLWVWPKGGEFLWVWCWSLIGGILAWCNKSVLWLGVGLTLILCLLYGLCLSLLMLGGWVPLVPSALALVVTSGSLLAYRFSSKNF
ncbi:CHASE2 domain-containing protein [Phormidium sp. LEGE 05292]|uniref:CHASE2 domain-containing protein n=1 Tax=[Phormidium] sp. LEGE 05292 TaxID=767427 RepID=UPI001880E969|nr:CHASE2 domain-containing protein [Phormidium sp. LEGE 05292]MBE9227020.1 CHASE2 domain-containing protein [Phormidium sp. LEGE 05292]